MSKVWKRTLRPSYGGGRAVKTIDLKDAERYIAQCLEGKWKGIDCVMFSTCVEIEKAIPSTDGGYDFMLSNKDIVSIDCWNYFCLEHHRNTLYVFLADIKPDME